ncbi:tetratricopeptide repeat protein [Dongia deserti]|uniref:tetratricopeptide repeat protein n=1 Tax=Dongia deserti TaxID=2268030 RepID=UPI000E646A72|nr:tetratricopeptide repeat protein [Dongia deserti]
MRRTIRWFLAALMALGTLSILATQLHVKPAAAVAFGKDDRHPVQRTKGTEGAAIGLVFYQAANGQFAAGTGFLVSPCHVLTAYHVAAGGYKVDETTTSTFYVGDGKIGPDFPDLNRFAESSIARPVVWGRYVRLGENNNLLVRAQSVERNGWEDWALLELDKCFGAKPYSYGYLKLSPVTTREIMRGGASIAARSVGLPGDKSVKSLWEDPTCRLIGQIYASGWQHDCITIPGNSGGPLLIKDPVTGEQRVAAITVSHIAVEGLSVAASDALVLGRDDPNYYDYLAIAVPIAGLIERIQPYLTDDARVERFLAKHRIDDHYSSERSSDAIEDLGAAITANAKNPELHLLRAIWNRYAGRDEDARRDLDAVLALDENFAPARYLRARMELEDGDADSLKLASGDFTVLANKHADSPDVLLYRAIAQNRASSYDAAIADLDRVLKRQPKSAVAVNERGDAWRGLRNYERALADYSKAITFASDWPEAYRDRGYLYHLLARSEEARGDFNRAIKLNARDAEAWNGRALVSLSEGRISEAVSDFNRALELMPQSAAYYANRATARMIDGEEKRAIEDFRRAVQLDPDEPFVNLLYYIAQARAGEMERAKTSLEKFAAQHPDQDWPRPIVDLFLGRGSTEAVERAAKVAAHSKDVAGQRFDADFYIGQWALLAGDQAAAMQRLKSVYDSRMREYLEFDIARADLNSLGSIAETPTRTPIDPKKNVPTGSKR